jgi:hypothetical protein
MLFQQLVGMLFQQLVGMLFQQLVRRQQDVFALLVPSLLTSCQRLVEDLLQGC